MDLGDAIRNDRCIYAWSPVCSQFTFCPQEEGEHCEFIKIGIDLEVKEYKIIIEILEKDGIDVKKHVSLFIKDELGEDVENIVSDFMMNNYVTEIYNFHIIDDHHEIEWVCLD